ncbi:hypothetical protein A9R05_43005 (plasmid) [Burkholderia sp. KK1]|uniref:Disulphide bond corrector protein DsbC n=1 Tax=Burkholderia sp. M701 TaxID=326454 RepID=V5YNP6_9BURK|nr:protein-disulfide reductase DsbD N-terminal domain-containing protein [Burkholderia sp. M701]AQH05790.1 hypothetical protein A9R05_43005 [Burkholderia sp. KK1]BAO19012.1 disulphide bond corrector protein DsbC [Burkholderia sp. M701]
MQNLAKLVCAAAAALVTPAAMAAQTSASPDIEQVATGESPALLSPEQAFGATVHKNGQQITIDYRIADGYYLYRDRMSIETTPPGMLGATTFQAGESKTDRYFGTQVVYKHKTVATAKVKDGAPRDFTVQVHYQGCAAVGVCYPPQTRIVDIASCTDKKGETSC